jgi:hypothetical protein
MPLIRFKPLILALAALTLLSALGGATVYYMHLSVLRSLASPPSLGESLDAVAYMEYSIRVGDEEYTVKIRNSPEAREGVAEIYRGGELLYKIRYRYAENTLTYVAREQGGEVEELDPVEYEDAFFTSLRITTGPAGEINAEPFPGVAPLQAPFYITRSMGVNWDSFIRGAGPGVPVNINVEFRGVSTPLGSSRGILVTIIPQNPVLAISVWMKAPLQFELARVDGLLLAPTLVYDVVLAQGGQGIEIRLLAIETAG